MLGFGMKVALGSTKHLMMNSFRGFSKVVIELGSIGESVSEATVKSYDKQVGDWVEIDDMVMTLESAKNDAQSRTHVAGVITKYLVEVGDDVEVGAALLEIDTAATKPEGTPQPVETAKQEAVATPVAESKPVEAPKPVAAKIEAPTPAKVVTPQKAPAQSGPLFTTTMESGNRSERREKMSRMRRTVAGRLKESQNMNATVTTFQEIDMKAVMDIRKELGAEYLKAKGMKLGFMSFFIKACARGLVERPIVNAGIDTESNEIVWKNYVDISVAVSAPKGLVTPIIRNVENMNFTQVEQAMAELATKAKDNKLAIEDMTGGTFSISNGGVFGSMLSAPIINPPMSAIMGMHNIVNRPVVRGGQIVSRPIMYVSLSYDHRLLDGREGAGYLRRVADFIEDPRRLLLEL